MFHVQAFYVYEDAYQVVSEGVLQSLLTKREHDVEFLSCYF